MREITNFRPGGAKSKKLATKQTTLFGLPAGNATKKSSKESKENTQVQTGTQDTQDTLTNGESQELGQDVSMVDEESTLSTSAAISQEETQLVNGIEEVS